MTISDLIALPGLLAGVVAAFYAWKAYVVSKELTFPAKKAHTNACYLKPLSKNAEAFRFFLEKNNFKKRVANAFTMYYNINCKGRLTQLLKSCRSYKDKASCRNQHPVILWQGVFVI